MKINFVLIYLFFYSYGFKFLIWINLLNMAAEKIKMKKKIKMINYKKDLKLKLHIPLFLLFKLINRSESKKRSAT